MKQWLSKDTVEWATHLWLQLRGNRLARIAGLLVLAAIAAMSNAVQLVIIGVFALAGTNIQLPDTPWWVVVFCIVVSAALLIFDRLFPAPRQAPNRNDIALYAMFQQCFPDRMRRFLEEHSFGDDWADNETAPLFTFEYEWKGARYQFQDKELDAALAAVKRKCDELVTKIARYSAPARHGVPRMTVKTEHDRAEGLSKQTMSNIKDLNETATALKDLIDRVDLLARQKLG